MGKRAVLRKLCSPFYRAARCPEITARPGITGTCLNRFKSFVFLDSFCKNICVEMWIDMIEYSLSFYGSIVNLFAETGDFP